MRKTSWLPACLLLDACRAAFPAPQGAAELSLLRARTQELLDAVSAGDASVWDRYTDPEIIYVSEAGEVETKATLLAQIKPLPPGISGSLRIGRFEARVMGDTAVTMYVADEAERYFGQPIAAQYLTTATWRRGPYGWRMIGAQVLAMLIDPPSLSLPEEVLEDYVGTYELTGDVTYTITRDGAELVGQRSGRPPQALKVEVRDVLFVPGQPRSRKIFLRDAAGAVVKMADRREARDVIWTRRAPHGDAALSVPWDSRRAPSAAR